MFLFLRDEKTVDVCIGFLVKVSPGVAESTVRCIVENFIAVQTDPDPTW